MDVELTSLGTRLEVAETQVTAAQEEAALVKEDLARVGGEEEERMRRDREVRDMAVVEKNKAWIELSQTKVTLINANNMIGDLDEIGEKNGFIKIIIINLF